jgi:arylsulfatase A-like enzyme
VCASTRGSFLTGRRPHIHGELSNGFSIAPGEVWWPELLSEAGYLTASIGKLHLEPWDDDHGWDYRYIVEGKDFLKGDDEYAVFCTEKYGYRRPKKKYMEQDLKMWDSSISDVPYEDYIDRFIADRALAYLEETKDDERPLALHVSMVSPHHPVDPPKEFYDKYAGTPVPEKAADDSEAETKPETQGDHATLTRKVSEEKRQEAWRSYYALVDLVDEQVGRIMEKLREVGRDDNCLVIFTTDHGEMLYDHGLFDKAFFFYEPVIHVPAVVSWRGRLPEGSVCDAFIQNYDVVATTLAAAGLEVPDYMSSKNLIPLMKGEVEKIRDYTVTEHFNIRCIRTETMKLVYYANRDYGELYDLGKDPKELENLWGDSSCSDVKNELIRKLLDWSVFSTDRKFREWDAATNKGEYTGYLQKYADTSEQYLPRSKRTDL